MWKVKQMNMLKQLNAAIEYIEENLCAEVKIDTAAKIACVTADSFIRFFSYMTGMTLTEYVRCRRLTLAAQELQESKTPIVEIAVKYGYNSATAFSRAFTKQHGITPAQARDPHQSLKIYSPVSFHIIIKGAKEMDFKVIEIKEKKVLGISKCIGGTSSERFGAEHIMWADNCECIPSKICCSYDGIWYGIFENGNYVIARDQENVTGTNLETYFIPGGKYAVFTTKNGGYAGDELPQLHDLIHNSWIKNSGYCQIGDFELEVYHLYSDKAERRRKRYYEIWIPIESIK